ncbi:hypothetical protein AZ78_1988 [Lysobacter capsici AZ78]|uniref:Uncharacterized protein n=1 Tax=Lysobacter capsici AZ78 TaxID=1444315 RepID=A0A108U8F2_9GAMM|nr:hypothetical protein AZ78_1988 [Lysobacter capsici AZ78]
MHLLGGDRGGSIALSRARTSRTALRFAALAAGGQGDDEGKGATGAQSGTWSHAVL